MIPVTAHLAIEESEVEVRFVCSGGPGGQNVNKLATAARLRFDAAGSPSLPDDVRRRLLAHAGRRATADGVIIVQAQRFRSQEQNRADAIERLLAMLRVAATPPRPRHATRPSRSSKARRLDAKRRRSQTKRHRARPDETE